MRKVFFVLICFTAVTAVHAAGVGEFRGRNYLVGEWAAAIAFDYALQEDVRDFEIDAAISNNRLYFIMPIYQQHLPNGILQSGHIQNGDIITTWEEDGFSVDVVYRGQRRNVRDLFPTRNSRRFALSYAQYGGTITIFEIVTDVEIDRDFRMLE